MKPLPSQIHVPRTDLEQAQDEKKMNSLHAYQALLYRQGYYHRSKNPVYKPRQLMEMEEVPDPNVV